MARSTAVSGRAAGSAGAAAGAAPGSEASGSAAAPAASSPVIGAGWGVRATARRSGKDPDDGGRVVQAALQHGPDGIVERDPVQLDFRFLVGTFVQLVAGDVAQATGQVDADRLAGGARRVEEVGQHVPARSHQVSFLREL